MKSTNISSVMAWVQSEEIVFHVLRSTLFYANLFKNNDIGRFFKIEIMSKHSYDVNQGNWTTYCMTAEVDETSRIKKRMSESNVLSIKSD
jgi:hypothetical protein